MKTDNRLTDKEKLGRSYYMITAYQDNSDNGLLDYRELDTRTFHLAPFEVCLLCEAARKRGLYIEGTVL